MHRFVRGKKNAKRVEGHVAGEHKVSEDWLGKSTFRQLICPTRWNSPRIYVRSRCLSGTTVHMRAEQDEFSRNSLSHQVRDRYNVVKFCY